jgi:hypothetical protein
MLVSELLKHKNFDALSLPGLSALTSISRRSGVINPSFSPIATSTSWAALMVPEARLAAVQKLETLAWQFRIQGWTVALGASGTIKAAQASERPGRLSASKFLCFSSSLTSISRRSGVINPSLYSGLDRGAGRLRYH